MSSLDEILNELVRNARRPKPGPQNYTVVAAAQIKAWVAEEIIGTDEPTGHSALEQTLNLHPLYHNELRAEQRKRLEQS